eukprot:12093935-Ditylum_brightwellii.AAC.1
MPRNSCHARGHKELLYKCLKHKGDHAEGDPPKKLVWCRREQSGSATSGFWKGRASAGIAHRQGKRNM